MSTTSRLSSDYTAAPFDHTGLTRDATGAAHYTGLPDTIVDMLANTVARAPDVTAVVEPGGQSLTYRQLWDRSARLAGGLLERGIKLGDRVAIRMPNCIDWMVSFFGALMAGAVVVPVNIRLSQDEIAYLLEDSGAALVLDGESEQPVGAPFRHEELSAASPAAIFYTSGTTGRPKGAVGGHAGFVAVAESCRRAYGITEQEPGALRTLVCVPLFHTTGCNAQMLAIVKSAGTSVLVPGFQTVQALNVIRDERINLLVAVPSIYWLLLNSPDFQHCRPETLRWALFGGAPMAPELLERLARAFPNARLGNGFGLTETSSLATFLPHEQIMAKPESVGYPAPGVDVRLHEPDTGGVGELLVRGPGVFLEYWQNAAATRPALDGGWLHTGDLARIDQDGCIAVVDRIKDVVIRGGENVYSVEVENALVAFGGVMEAAVIGVPDEVMGQRVGAVVVAQPGITLDPIEIRQRLRDKLADYKCPEFIAITTEPLARNANGKVLKKNLRPNWSAAFAPNPDRRVSQ